jgi:hypothetical protein
VDPDTLFTYVVRSLPGAEDETLRLRALLLFKLDSCKCGDDLANLHIEKINDLGVYYHIKDPKKRKGGGSSGSAFIPYTRDPRICSVTALRLYLQAFGLVSLFCSTTDTPIFPVFFKTAPKWAYYRQDHQQSCHKSSCCCWLFGISF